MGVTVLHSNYKLDVSGLACPMPIVKLKKFLAEHVNESLMVALKATDKGALKDIPAFCRLQQIDCLYEGEDQGIFQFKLTRIYK